MDDMWPVYLVFLVFAILFSWVVVRSEKETIQQLLEERKATNITIRYIWFDFDKSNNSFEVDYVDYAGVHRNTVYKMGLWTGGPYWEEEPPRTRASAQSAMSALAEIRQKREKFEADLREENHE